MYGENTTIDAMQRVQEEMDSRGHQHEGRERAKVREAVITVLRILGYNNTVDDIKLDNRQFQVHFNGYLTNAEKTPVEQLVAEQLKIPADNIRLVGFCNP